MQSGGNLTEDSNEKEMELEVEIKNVQTGSRNKGKEHSIWQMYKALVRMHWSNEFWSPYYGEEVVIVGRVQRRFTRMLAGKEGCGCRRD